MGPAVEKLRRRLSVRPSNQRFECPPVDCQYNRQIVVKSCEGPELVVAIGCSHTSLRYL